MDSIFDNIIKKLHEEADFAYADFDRYRVEVLGHDPDDLFNDYLDDFRYGLERSIDVIREEIAKLKK